MTNELTPHTRHEPAHTTRMDAVVDATTAQRVASGFSANTRRAYAHHLTRYQNWCHDQDRTPYPASPQTLASWVSHLRDDGKAPSTVEVSLSAVRSEHTRLGHAVNTEGARLALRDHKRTWAENGGRTKQAAAITPEQLRAMIDQAPTGTLSGIRDRALLTLGFAGMFRRSDLSRLNISDVHLTSEGLEVFLSQSKTDQDAHGHTRRMAYGTRRDTCPVRSTLEWINALASLGIETGALLRGVDRHGKLSGTPGASGSTSQRLSPLSIGRAIQRLAERAGVEGVSGHSLRAGAATTAAKAGVDRSDIAEQGQWHPESTAIERYIRPGQGWDRTASRHLGL